VRVLILDGNENQAVACVRSLARAGHTALVGSAAAWSKAGWSRWCTGTFRYPAPEEDVSAFVRRIAEEAARQPGGALVLPLTERTTLPLSGNRDLLSASGARLVLPAHETVVRAFDKYQTIGLAEGLGVAVPQTVLVEEDTDAAKLASTLRYPTVLKPRSSQEGTASLRATGPPRYARDAAEMLAAHAEMRQRCRSVLVQEFVEGVGVGYFALVRHGESRLEFGHRRLRDVRPTGSGSSLRVSIVPPPAVRDAGRAVLRALGWHGVAMVEFRVRPDGTPVFMEVNGRFWASLALAVHAGADFPAQLAHLAEHGDVAPAPPCRAGVRCRWLLGDCRHLLAVLRGPPRGFPGKFPGRLRTLFSVLLPVPGTHHDNFTYDDPLPELGDWLDVLLRRVPGRWRKRGEAA
jgi:predicted ATP-grasp superfamily ATP-dependent carboligase